MNDKLKNKWVFLMKVYRKVYKSFLKPEKKIQTLNNLVMWIL